MKMQMMRKTATKLLLVQWSRFQNICIRLEGSTLLTGVNGSGKSTILDAMTYLLTGNTQFNKAAKDRDRTVGAYVRGDTKSNGPARFLRTGEVVSYIAMEFWSPIENAYMVIGVCIESANDTSFKSNWFICRNTQMDQMNFTVVDGQRLEVTPRNKLAVNGKTIKSADFYGKERGIDQILRALGLRCDAAKYRSKLLKMMAFRPENNIDQFIQECVLESGKVGSLNELREQRQQFERIKELYDNLRDSKVQLEEVERKSMEYEKKKRNFHIRELMLSYQQLKEKEAENKDTKTKLETFKHKKITLEERKKELDKQYEDAAERYRIAGNNDLLQVIGNLERQSKELQIEIENNENELAKVIQLQGQLSKLLEWIEEYLDITEKDKKYLQHIAEGGFDEENKYNAFLRLSEMLQKQNRNFQKEEIHCEDRIEKLDIEINELEMKIKHLQANKRVFPKQIEDAKRIIRDELKKQGIQTDVRVFAELVQEVKSVEWRTAIETYLGRKRFYIIVDDIYCYKAMEIVEQKELHGVNVVITDKLPEMKITPGSAAEVLTIPNVFARRYANYLLNGIHLCDTLNELHEYPKGALMKNGMLAKSYAVSYMNLKKTELCLGEDTIKLQLQKALEEKNSKKVESKQNQKDLEQILQMRKEIEKIDWDVKHYNFQAATLLEEKKDRKKKLQRDAEKIRSNSDFIAVLQEQEDAGQAYKMAKNRIAENERNIGIYITKIQEKEEVLKKLTGEIYVLEQEYKDKCLQHLELKRPMQEEYNKLRDNKGSWQVITEKTVKNLEGEVREAIKQMEDAQLRYCKLAELDINKRGVPYIPFFREEYRNISNIKIEEAHQRLDEQAKRLESAFMNDFVAEINETIREAKREIEQINRELKQIPFGNDTYKFIMKEKPDRSVFFRICRKLESYMDSPEVYMNSGRDDEEMEHDIQEFMSVILDEEDEAEYTDYRKYFVYDMEIISRQGENEIISDLSKKQGSASNGEKQTPYFIILAASLMQYYPKQVCCARLAFIDEAFSALSRERIEQMVKYFEENQFQVFYAAPPEKISSIGTFIESTVSLVITGRYTNAIEGLVKGNEEDI